MTSRHPASLAVNTIPSDSTRAKGAHMAWFPPLRKPAGRLAAALAAALMWAPGAVLAQDMSRIEFTDAAGQAITAGVWTPNAAPPGARPLIVISHGNGGGFMGHADTAEALAGAGFVVAALNHPHDNNQDMSRSTQLTDRPAEVSALIDHMTTGWRGPVEVDASRIGAFGFSAGAFTVLAPAGAESDGQAILDHCAGHPEFFVCTLFTPETLNLAEWRPAGGDPRVKAVTAAAPGFGFSFSDESLRGVTIPVQLWQAEDDQILPAPFHVETVRDRLGGSVEYHPVPLAGHLDFMRPCSPEMAAAAPEICRSNPGFDRAAFKRDFNEAVVVFFLRTLVAG